MARSRNRAWYEDYFGPDYLIIDIHEYTDLEVEFIRKVLKLKHGTRLLDIGCGYGRHLIPLLAHGVDVVGCDLSQFMLREAARCIEERAKAHRRGRNYFIRWCAEGYKLVCSDNRTLPFR